MSEYRSETGATSGGVILDSPLERLPLIPARQEARPYPVESLGNLLGAAAVAIADIVQVPVAIAAQSVLAAAALTTQDFADVLLPIGPDGLARPLSLFMVTIAESGDRKSGADSYACRAINDFEEK